MIELDTWFTQFGVGTQKLCKLQVPDSGCAEVAGRPGTFAKHILHCHKTIRDPPMDPYALDIQANTRAETCQLQAGRPRGGRLAYNFQL